MSSSVHPGICQHLCVVVMVASLARSQLSTGSFGDVFPTQKIKETYQNSSGTDIEGSGDSETVDADYSEVVEADDYEVVDEDVVTPPPINTELRYSMDTKPAGEGISVTIYFTVLQDAMKMYCEVSAQAGTPAARNWPKEFPSTDLDSSNLNGTSVAGPVGDVNDTGAVIIPARQVFIDKDAPTVCSRKMPHLYVMKDITCCGDPSLPQCTEIEGKKLGCIEATGKSIVPYQSHFIMSNYKIAMSLDWRTNGYLNYFSLGVSEHTFNDLSYYDLESYCLAITDKEVSASDRRVRNSKFIAAGPNLFRTFSTLNFNSVNILSSGTSKCLHL